MKADDPSRISEFGDGDSVASDDVPGHVDSSDSEPESDADDKVHRQLLKRIKRKKEVGLDPMTKVTDGKGNEMIVDMKETRKEEEEYKQKKSKKHRSRKLRTFLPLKCEQPPSEPTSRQVPVRQDPVVYRDVGDDQENYVGFIGSSIGGSTRFTKSILGKQTLGDVCTLTRKVPSFHGFKGSLV